MTCDPIAPVMTNNEALRRILYVLTTEGGLPVQLPAPPSTAGSSLVTVRAAAANPAARLLSANPDRKGLVIRNLDNSLPFFYGSDPNVTQATGATLRAGENVPLGHLGPLYVFAPTGSPMAEALESL